MLREYLLDVSISKSMNRRERFFYEIKNNNFKEAEKLLKEKVSFLQQIFSLKNEGNHKIVRILGIKIKLNKKGQND